MADVIDAVATDWLPSRVDDRAALRQALRDAAAVHTDLHIGIIRLYLRRDVEPHQIGAFMTAMVRRGVLVWDGGHAANGNTRTRNAQRPVKTYRLAAPIPEED